MFFTDEEKIIISKILESNDIEEAYKNLLRYTNYKTDCPIFKINDSVKWYIVNYEVIEEKNKTFWRFEEDENIYSCKGNFYMLKKKQLLKLYNKLIELLNNKIDYDLKDHINKKYVQKLKSCGYYDFIRWFNMLFIFYVTETQQHNAGNCSLNYKMFRRWVVEYNKKYINNISIVKNILTILNKLNLNNEIDEAVKIFSNITIPYLLFGSKSSLP